MKKKIEHFQRIKASWAIGLFPVFALAICGFLFYDYYQKRGPQIRIEFDDASSLTPQKTKVRFRGVTVGSVENITLAEDNRSVIAHITLLRESNHLAVAGSRFWVVEPKVGFQGVSGLETIFEGTYIAVQPGPPDGEPKTEFKGSVGAGASDPLEDTSSYILETRDLGSVNPGDAVTFRGLQIGSITKTTLSKTAQTILIQINIENRYVKLIRTNTVFWRKVAVQAKLGLFNSEIKVNSLDSVLRGGVELFTPDKPGEIAKAAAKFTLLPGPPKDYEKWNPEL